MAHFHLGLPLAHNHPPLSLSAKISKNTGISLYTATGLNGRKGEERRGEARRVSLLKWYAHNPSAARLTNSPVISRHDLSRSRVRAVVEDG